MSASLDARMNRLLAALSESDWKTWSTQLERVRLTQGQVLHEPGTVVTHAYLPTTAVVSMKYILNDGAAPEVATVGNEGVVGISLFMGGDWMPARASVLSAGEAFRLTASSFKRGFEHSAPIMRSLLRYTQALITQIGQTGVCTRHHAVGQQLSRWLLLNLDRIPGRELVMTQELIANTLGIRREAVSDAAFRLQDAGLIRYKRGHIVLLDRAGLERRACECYAVVRNEYDRLLAPPSAQEEVADLAWHRKPASRTAWMQSGSA